MGVARAGGNRKALNAKANVGHASNDIRFVRVKCRNEFTWLISTVSASILLLFFRSIPQWNSLGHGSQCFEFMQNMEWKNQISFSRFLHSELKVQGLVQRVK